MCVCFAVTLVSITVWGVDSQVNWDGRDAFVGACYPVSLCLNFRPHLIKIHKLLPFAVQEFSIFCTNRAKATHRKGGERERKGQR